MSEESLEREYRRMIEASKDPRNSLVYVTDEEDDDEAK